MHFVVYIVYMSFLDISCVTTHSEMAMTCHCLFVCLFVCLYFRVLPSPFFQPFGSRRGHFFFGFQLSSVTGIWWIWGSDMGDIEDLKHLGCTWVVGKVALIRKIRYQRELHETNFT